MLRRHIAVAVSALTSRRAINALGTMNVLLADGKRLFAYHDRTGHKGLCLRSVHLRDQQSRRFEDMGAQKLVRIGGLLVATAAVLVSGGLVEGFPVALPYIGWAIGGLGMGIAFPTIPLSAMTVATRGREAGDLSSTLLMDFLGISIGAGLGGACVALADAGITTLRGGIAGAFAIGFVAAIGLALVAHRLPVGTPSEAATGEQ